MDSVKVKNFIILVLVIVNLALLVVVVRDNMRGSEQRRDAIEGAAGILSGYGIGVSEDADLSEREASVYSLSRSEGMEQQAAESILGSTEKTDRGGGIMYYSGALGEATFRSTGGVELQFYGISAPQTDDPKAMALEYTHILGATEAKDEGAVKVTAAATGTGTSSTTVEVFCAWQQARIINCRLTFTFTEGKLLYISGSRPLGETVSEQEAQIIDVPTVLMRFIELTQEKGMVCSMLEELELCYVYTASASGGGSLSPVWRLVTDTGELYVNALSGKEEAVS